MERPQRNQGKGGAGKAFKVNAFCYGNKKTNVTVQDGGKMGAKAGVKLAYKSVFAPIFTSDGHPMLLDRIFRSRRWAVLKSYKNSK